MIVISQKAGTFGVFKTVVESGDRLLCDSQLELLFSVIGSYEISGDDSLMPQPIPTSQVPEEVAMWKAKDFLIRRGLLQSVKDTIAAIPDPMERELAFNRFQNAPVCRRDDPVLLCVVTKAGFPEAEVDSWFIEAQAI